MKQKVRVRVYGRGRVHDQRGDGDGQEVLVHVRDLEYDQHGGGVVGHLCYWQLRCLLIIRLPTRCVYLK